MIMSTTMDVAIQQSDAHAEPRRRSWILSSVYGTTRLLVIWIKSWWNNIYQNRKLRHLQGVLIRNLDIAPPHGRGRGRTIDDDNAPNALQSPAKAIAKQESRSVHHSRSFTSFKIDQSHTTKSEDGNTQKEQSHDKHRRGTMPWSDLSLGIRQSRIEDIPKYKMADTWFSLHCADIEHPVYVSEVVPKSVNPDFNTFNLNACGPLVSRSDIIMLKCWAKTDSMPDYVLLLELNLNTKSLQYIGKALEDFHHPFPTNCVIFRFLDGLYANLTDAVPVETPAAPPKKSRDGAEITSSYDALLRLANLDDCIQDALATRVKLESQINTILHNHQTDSGILNRTCQAQENLSSVKKATSTARKQLRLSFTRKNEIVESLRTRRDAMLNGRSAQKRSHTFLSEAQTTMSSSEILLKQNTDDSTGQVRRICEDLLSIYSIEPIPGKPLVFTIVGTPLPNSSFEDINKEPVAAALGYTAQLVYMLSFYLSIPLPYPIQPYLSSSYINDPISVGLLQRTFPLYPVNIHYRFEYGVFLLNKDIGYLMDRMGLRILDIRHTLPNIKYLLYVLTAGTGELPARKAGGVRGLLMGRLTPNLSRRGSDTSTMSNNTTNGKKKHEGPTRTDSGSKRGHPSAADRPATPTSSRQPPNDILPPRLGGIESTF